MESWKKHTWMATWAMPDGSVESAQFVGRTEDDVRHSIATRCLRRGYSIPNIISIEKVLEPQEGANGQ